MEQFAHISAQETKKKLDENLIKVVDIRDEQSFANGRIPGSFHLSNASIARFIEENDFETPVVVCCYHGISSQQAAQYMVQQGFEEVYSMDGGFEAWRGAYEFETNET